MDAPAAVSGVTLVVHGIPSQADVESVESVFVSFGPVKRCFLVKKGAKNVPGERQSAFVTFALASDAARALESVNGTRPFAKKSGEALRPLRVSFADRRKPISVEGEDAPSGKKRKRSEEGISDKDNKKEIPEQKRVKRTRSDSPSPMVERSVLFTGVPEKSTRKLIREHASSLHLAPFVSLEFPVRIPPHRVCVDLQTKREKLYHARLRRTGRLVFSTNTIAGHAATSVNGSSMGDDLLSSYREHRVPRKSWRLVVRNLPFRATEQFVLKAFAPIGPVEVEFPLKDGHFQGFCFVQFEWEEHALEALQAMNGKKIGGRRIAVDVAVRKSDAEKGIEKEKAPEKGVVSDHHKQKGQRSDGDDGNSEEGDVSEGDVSEGDGDVDDQGTENVKEKGDDEISSSQSLSESDSDEGEVSAEPPSKKRTEKTEAERVQEQSETVFVRNVAIDASQSDLLEVFRKFGPIRYAVFVRHPVTKLPMGSAFVRFVSAHDAAACSAASRASSTPMEMNGRPLSVFPALSRDGVDRAIKERAVKGTKRKRDQELIGYSIVDLDNVPEKDKQRRERHHSETLEKLKSPNFFVSDVRLSIRNLPNICDSGKKLKEGVKNFVDASKIVQSKVVLDNRKKSRGFGFLQFSNHEAALEGLKTINNNPDVFGPKNRPIVEFALENVQALRKHEFAADRERKKAERGDTEPTEPKLKRKRKNTKVSAKESFRMRKFRSKKKS